MHDAQCQGCFEQPKYWKDDRGLEINGEEE